MSFSHVPLELQMAFLHWLNCSQQQSNFELLHEDHMLVMMAIHLLQEI